ncbi:peptide synthetase [Phaeobacter gallaeciensis]|uniref:Peptide synthetase n=1 Tax=Phaeobacter gallaeciensis TaxID=60890 RepID=A0A366XDJ4_9RHOB|nr:MupA/Atu3671 family FMN-dependent luciferase-like monooxygenase [Phaeobacter gallaeciensis]RBW61609.1 peptide synthetase [Phaeobacter gallaeciensis]
MTFSCVVIGNESLLIGCTEMLLERGHSVRAVQTQNAEIQNWAKTKGLPLVSQMNDLAEQFKTGDVDWLLSIANLAIIPEKVLALPQNGAINFHDGPLPKYAGLNTPAWAIFNGEKQHGITWHMIEGGIDEGDILSQSLFDIAEDETALSLNSKCYAAAMDSFPSVVDQLETDLNRRPQDLGQRNYFAFSDRPEAGGHLSYTQTAEVLSAHVRGLDFGAYWNPLTTSKILISGQPVRVAQAQILASASGSLPGTVVSNDPSGLRVATGSNDLLLEGLTTLSGDTIDFAALAPVGTRLAPISQDQAEQIAQQAARSLKGEPYWRKALTAMASLPLPLATLKQDGSWSAQRISVPHGLSDEQALTAVLAFALRSSGEEYGDIAVSNATLQDAAKSKHFSPWVPLQIRSSEPLAALTDRALHHIVKADALGGFAMDLPSRDPEIGSVTQPAFGLSLNGAEPIDGTDVTVCLSPGHATLHAHTGHLDAVAIEILARRLESAMYAVTQAPDGETVQKLAILPASERSQTLTDWNRTARDYNRTQTIHQAFESQVSLSPDETALVFESEQLTYAALNARANTVAEKLRAMGVGPGANVGLYVQRSVDLMVGALAILKAGGAYVPLDPAYPSDRIAHFVTDSRAAVILTQSTLQDSVPASSADVLCIDTVTPDLSAPNVDGGASADDLAYLIYTSGSTGTPKGVMVEHRNVANFFAGMDDRIDHQKGGVWLAVTSLSFDISVLELFWTLARGFKVVLSSDENRAVVSQGPIAVSDRPLDFNLMYWGNDDGPGPKKYKLLLEGAKFADANGFNAVWTPERHFHAFGGPYPNPAVTGAAVAAVTENLSVRAGSCVAPLHHPARIAEDWAIIDNLTGGRAALGIASGWQPDDFVLRPENTPPRNKPAMFETIETLRKLWRGEAVAFPKADGTMHEVVTQPRPVSNELPVWVTTAGNPETWKEAGTIGANVLTHLLGQSIDEVAEKIRIYHAALRAAGHDPAKFKVTLMLHTYLAETREEAARIAREPMKGYLRAAAGLIKQYAWAFPAFKKPQGVSNAFEMDLGVLSDDELEAILDFAFERYFEDSGLFGTVEDGLARAESLKRIGVDEIACLIDYGIDPDVVLEGLTPLAEVLKRANAPSTVAEDDFSLAAQILRHDVTHMQCTPSMARMIAMNDEARLALGRVKQLLLGGEALPGELVEDLRECTSASVLNMYGPTETTIWSTSTAVPAGASGTVSIGSPIANTAVYVLDAAGQPCPIGVPGELLIGGEGVTRGYWQRSNLTEERFVHDPFAAEAGLTVAAAPLMYRTGDLARWRTDGQIEFLGRSDHQVKIRGQRIELGEIESALAAFAGVSGAVVVANEKTPGDTRLAGYITTSGPVSDAALRDHLTAHLPEVMIPSHIMNLPAFPLTPNKKIDRKALPEPAAQQAPRDETPVQSDGIEGQIATIWARILGVGDIRKDDNFFTLGGHSLLAVQAHREIRETLNIPSLSITDIFRFPTLGGLAGHLSADAPATIAPQVNEPARTETMSKRKAMRANRRERT